MTDREELRKRHSSQIGQWLTNLPFDSKTALAGALAVVGLIAGAKAFTGTMADKVVYCLQPDETQCQGEYRMPSEEWNVHAPKQSAVLRIEPASNPQKPLWAVLATLSFGATGVVLRVLQYDEEEYSHYQETERDRDKQVAQIKANAEVEIQLDESANLVELAGLLNQSELEEAQLEAAKDRVRMFHPGWSDEDVLYFLKATQTPYQIPQGEAAVAPLPEVEAQKSDPTARKLVSFLKRDFPQLEEANLRHVSTHEGAAFNRYCLKGDGSEWISILLSGKTANYLQVSLDLENPPIIQTVAGAVGIDLPRSERKVFLLRDFLPNLNQEIPTLPIGVDLASRVWEVPLDPDEGSNFLVGGTTRSGKTNWLRGAVQSLTQRFDADRLGLFVIDGKRTEFTFLDGDSHLLLDIAREPEDALLLLHNLELEMKNRQQDFQKVGARNLTEYNNKTPELKDKSVICLFADEVGNVLNALDEDQKEEACSYLNSISSQGIAAGIFLILATQKPVKDDIPSRTKSNCSTRICFRVESFQDSMTVIKETGGHRLLGKGDMLASSSQFEGTQRLHALLFAQGSEEGSGEVQEGSANPKEGSANPKEGSANLSAGTLNHLLELELEDLNPANPSRTFDPFAPDIAPEERGAVVGFRRAGLSAKEICLRVWGVKKGGSEKYKAARERLNRILKELGE